MLNRLFASFSCFQYSFFSLQKQQPQPRLLFFYAGLCGFLHRTAKNPAFFALFTICFPTIYNLFSDHSPIIQKPALL